MTHLLVSIPMPPARKSRVLVAGATGYVGQQLVEELLDRGCAGTECAACNYCTAQMLTNHSWLPAMHWPEQHTSVLMFLRKSASSNDPCRYTVRALVRRSGQLLAAKEGRCEEAVGDVLLPESLQCSTPVTAMRSHRASVAGALILCIILATNAANLSQEPGVPAECHRPHARCALDYRFLYANLLPAASWQLPASRNRSAPRRRATWRSIRRRVLPAPPAS